MVEVVLEAEEVVDSLEGISRSYRARTRSMDETFLSISFKVYHMHTLRQENGEKIKKWLILTL